MKNNFLTAVIFSPFILFAQQKFELKGTLGFSHIRSGKANLVDLKDGHITSIKLENNKYSFTGVLGAPVMQVWLSISLDSTATEKQQDIILRNVYLEPGITELYHQQERMNDPYVRGGNVTMEEAVIFQKGFHSEVEFYDSAYSNSTYTAFISFIQQHPSSFLNNRLMEDLINGTNYNKPGLTFEKLDTLFDGYAPSLQNLAETKRLRERIAKLKETKIGTKAFDFTMNDTKEHPVSLSSYKGKYVLLDFWASWCTPCRAENPNVLAAYKKYHPKGLEILSVSLDGRNGKEQEAKISWLKAVKEDKLPWMQISELKGWDGQVVKDYGIGSIPSNFLINPDGIIVARNLKKEELQNTLAKFLK
jgi:thiol-disulfide isomerase/thioredoxin